MPTTLCDLKMRLIPDQCQILTQRQQQSLMLLAMNQVELAAYLDTILLENPTLEGDTSMWRGGGVPSSICDLYTDGSAQNLTEYLLEQLGVLKLTVDQAKRIRRLILDLDANGYLNQNMLSTIPGVNTGALEEDIRILQSFEPYGVGARNLSECLCIQLEKRGAFNKLPYQIAASYLEYIEDDRLSELAELLCVKVGDVKKAVGVIRSLNPKPGNGFGNPAITEYVVPEISINRQGEHFFIELKSDGQLPLTLSQQYIDLYQTTDDRALRAYLAQKLQEGRDLIYALTRRKKTLLSCAQTILERQLGFFLNGPGNRKPLSMTDTALALNLHVSTVSRAVKEKYLRCEYGLYPLSYFFVRSVHASSTAETVMQHIRELISRENSSFPLSDGEVSSLLQEMGIAISRRTVAKYRSQMHIPSALLRGCGQLEEVISQ